PSTQQSESQRLYAEARKSLELCDAAKEKAKRAGAEEFAPQEFEEASRLESTANKELIDGSYRLAEANFQAAYQRFVIAGQNAREGQARLKQEQVAGQKEKSQRQLEEDQREILKLLDHYKTALESRDPTKIRALWPN